MKVFICYLAQLCQCSSRGVESVCYYNHIDYIHAVADDTTITLEQQFRYTGCFRTGWENCTLHYD